MQLVQRPQEGTEVSQHPDPAPDGRLLYPSLAVVKPTGWLLVNWVFFWPSAIYSLVAHWEKIDPAIHAGNLFDARTHAAKVRTIGITALWIGLIIIAAVIVHILLRPVSYMHA